MVKRRNPKSARTHAETGFDAAKSGASAPAAPGDAPPKVFWGVSRSAWLTILGAVVFPVVVFFWLAFDTSGSPEAQTRIRQWQYQQRTLDDAGEGLAIPIGHGQSVLGTTVPGNETGYNALTFDFYLENPAAVEYAMLIMQDPHELGNARVLYDLRGAGIQFGWTRGIRVSVDDAPELPEAKTIGILVNSLSDRNAFGVRNVLIGREGPAARMTRMARRVFAFQKLTQKHNNVILGPQVAGMGYAAIFWIGLLPAAALVLLRWFFARRRMSLWLHLGLTAFVMFMLLDARNAVDYVGQFRAAYALRRGSVSVPEYIGKLEASMVPWFPDALDTIESHKNEPYYLLIKPRGGTAVLRRLQYYALPIRAADSLEEATLALVWNDPEGERQLQQSGAWKLDRGFPSGLMVYRRPAENVGKAAP